MSVAPQQPFRLETSRLILREWREADRLPFADISADPAVMEHYPAVLTRAESDQIIGRQRAHHHERRYGFWALELREGAELIGRLLARAIGPWLCS